MELELNLRRSFKWKFVIADVSTPILGADFFYHHNLLVDLRNRRLIDGLIQLKIVAQVTSKQTQSVYIFKHQHAFSQILMEFSDITKSAHPKTNKNTIEHHILTQGHPITDRARHLTPEKLKFAKKKSTAGLRKEIANQEMANGRVRCISCPKRTEDGESVEITDD